MCGVGEGVLLIYSTGFWRKRPGNLLDPREVGDAGFVGFVSEFTRP